MGHVQPHFRTHVLSANRRQMTACVSCRKQISFVGDLAGPDALSESFVVLDHIDSSSASSSSLSSRTTHENGKSPSSHSQSERITRILHICSDPMALDYPLCSNCGDAVCLELEGKLKEAERDVSLYQSTLKYLSENHQSEVTDFSDEALVLAESELISQISVLRSERKQLQFGLEQSEKEVTKLESLEHRLFDEYHNFGMELSALSSEHASLKQAISIAADQLERLKRCNVLDDAFHISFDGHFGTINGFRLGTLPSLPVDWTEINAALGHASLLLASLARRLGYTFKRFRLIPLGSFSKMAKLDDPNSLFELHCSDLSLNRIFWHQRFSVACEWFVQCIKELAEWAEQADPTFKLPHAIVDDKIDDFSCKLSFRKEESWTNALKLMLRNLKYLLAWSIRHLVPRP